MDRRKFIAFMSSAAAAPFLPKVPEAKATFAHEGVKFFSSDRSVQVFASNDSIRIVSDGVYNITANGEEKIVDGPIEINHPYLKDVEDEQKPDPDFDGTISVRFKYDET